MSNRKASPQRRTAGAAAPAPTAAPPAARTAARTAARKPTRQPAAAQSAPKDTPRNPLQGTPRSAPTNAPTKAPTKAPADAPASPSSASSATQGNAPSVPDKEGGSDEGGNGAAGMAGVAAVARALALLDAFGMGEASLSLAELGRRCGMHKTTALRLARTLAQSHYMVQTESGQWRLGPAAGWLGARYHATFDANDAVQGVLRSLAEQTRESASFYVREGNIRACVARVEGPQSVRHHVRVGATLPLDAGAPGRVILAFGGERGEPYETIRQRGWHLSMGEREADVASLAAPVFTRGWRLLGSLCISGPAARLTRQKLQAHAADVVRAANGLSYRLGGGAPAGTAAGAAGGAAERMLARWHP